jgi:triosephosphate isomerase (TIM)
MRKLIVANWKENPRSEAAALTLFKAIARVQRPNADVVVCPPFVYLEEVVRAYKKMSASAKKNLAIGAQDVFWEERGAFTSEVGPNMLKALGVRHVIIGHSERRKFMHETDAMINAKMRLALKDGLHLIVCVGEPLAVRKRGLAAAQAFVKNQLKRDVAGIKAGNGLKANNLTIAYEPIWAIGTGRNDSPEDARAMASFVKHAAKGAGAGDVRFLYGGSVHGANAGDYIQYKEIDGALVGGASLQAKEFKKIIITAWTNQ